jgi:hypothetical protein
VIVTGLELEFADGEYSFDLKLPQLAELQEKRGCGVFAIYSRVLRGRVVVGDMLLADTSAGESYAEDLFEVIRLGLIGGGGGIVDGETVKVDPGRARKLVERYCHPAPLKDSWAIAAAVLGARIEGYSPPKKATPAEQPAPDQTGSTSATP